MNFKAIFTRVLFMFALIGFTVTAQAQETIIQHNELPANAQKFLRQYFPGQKINYIKKDKKVIKTKYEVNFQNRTEVEFDGDGNWKEVEGKKRTAIPTGFIPQKIRSYAAQNFPSEKITKIEKSWRKYEVELSNGLELIFDTKGNFTRIDD